MTHERADTAASRSPVTLAIVLLASGLIGWFASAALLVERIRSLQNPTVSLSCDVSPFVTCGALFDRWQASLLGFPNPILGVAGFVAPIVVAAGLLAGARFSAWYWQVFTAGVLGAWIFVTWLFAQSVFVIGVLCPYCMVVWAVTIPQWWFLVSWALRSGALFGTRARRFGEWFFPFAWVAMLANYAVIVISILVKFPFLLSG